MSNKVILGGAYYGRKKVGRYIADAAGVWLEKPVRYSEHHYQMKPGWACDVAHIEKLISLGGLGVRLMDREKGGVWESLLSVWDRYMRPLNYGMGRQYLLPDEYWRFTPNKQARGAA